MIRIGGLEGCLSGGRDLLGPTVMEILRGQESDSRMVVLLIVPVEERNIEESGVFNATKTRRKLRPVLERLEVGFRVRVIIAGIGAAMGLCNTQVGQQTGHRLGCH